MSASSASGSINTQLTDNEEILKSMQFKISTMFTFSMTILFFCLFIFCMNAIIQESNPINFEPSMLRMSVLKCNCVDGKCNCRNVSRNNMYIENFSNDSLYSFKKSNRSSYQSIPLLAPLNDNLLFGQAKRFITVQNETDMIYRLEVYCNLFLLNGNIYDTTDRNNINQKYSVILRNSKTNERGLKIGDLIKDGDGVYKLKYKSSKNVDKLATYDKIDIIYTLDNNDQVLLSGKFN